MSLYQLKRHLTIDETIHYINNHSIGLNVTFDDLLDFSKENRITFLCLFNGYAVDENQAYSKIKAYVTANDLAFNYCYDEYYDDFFRVDGGFFKLQQILEKDSNLFDNFDDIFLFFRMPFNDDNQLTSVSKCDIRIDKLEIDKFLAESGVKQVYPIYQPTTDQSKPKEPIQAQINELKNRIVELEKENEQLANQLNKANANIMELENQQLNIALANELQDITAIQAINGAYYEFWQKYNPKDTPPKQITITDWITANYPEIKNSMALWLDKILRQKYSK